MEEKRERFMHETEMESRIEEGRRKGKEIGEKRGGK